MKRKTADEIQSNLPSLLSTLGGYLKSIVSLKEKKDLIDNASGTIGFLIKLFGKPLLDHYFTNVSTQKLADFGFNTYCKAAFIQVNSSLEFIKILTPNDLPLSEAALGLEKDFLDQISTLEKNISIYVFQPKYHPGVQIIKSLACSMLEKLLVDKSTVNIFKKNFNENIEKEIASEFGDDYDVHKSNIDSLWFSEKETKLLIDTINGSRIGFVENENLKYEDAYGSWRPTSVYSYYPAETNEKDISKEEAPLKPVMKLIDDYFSVDFENHLDKILFIVADFGKGKSVFLKQYASFLAQEYLETGEGYFPIYFNLRSFSKYNQGDSSLGVLDDFLQTDYGIKVSSDLFISKRYVFLIDSLDESCDLTQASIDRVINSVRKIQNLDKTKYRTNKLIITTRPFDDVLFNLINHNKPFIIKNEKDREITHYLSLYGFKKEQFNDWIFNTLLSIKNDLDLAATDGFILEIITSIVNNVKTDVYSILLENGTLSKSELRRPIFAYMIYQLIKNNVNITKIGKIGIYLSFLNLLSKEAKYINDPDLKICLPEQFEARSILHQISALWLFERQKGKQGSLKKADICRMIGNFQIYESDEEVLRKYRDSGGNDIQFLSHSYFGENDNILHFQHQSFAEILLAEYYLKVLIKFTLDRPIDLDLLISKLKIGQPTDQTIEFFIELLTLLKSTIGEIATPDLLEKRRLLAPLLASIAIDKNNRSLNSPKLFYQWYSKGNVTPETNEIPHELLENWCVDKDLIDGIVNISEKIITSEKIYILSKTESYTPLIDDEVASIIDSNYDTTLQLEKYLALIAGNTLYNTDTEYFIRKFSTRQQMHLLRNAEYDWLKNSFRGLNLNPLNREGRLMESEIAFNLSASMFDFSHSEIHNLIFYNCSFNRCEFGNSTFKNVSFFNSRISKCHTNQVKLEGTFDIVACSFDDLFFLPIGLTKKVLNRALKKNEQETALLLNLQGQHGKIDIQSFLSFRTPNAIGRFFSSLSFYFKYCFENDYMTEEEIMAVMLLEKPEHQEFVRRIFSEIKTNGFYTHKKSEPKTKRKKK